MQIFVDTEADYNQSNFSMKSYMCKYLYILCTFITSFSEWFCAYITVHDVHIYIHSLSVRNCISQDRTVDKK